MLTTYIHKLRLFNRNVWLYLIIWALSGFAYSGVFMVLFNLFLLRLGYGPEFVGLVNGVGLFALALFSLPAGALGRRWGSRRMMVIGMGLLTVGFVSVPLAEAVPADWRAGWLLAVWGLVCFSAPLLTVNGSPFLMAATSPEERDHAFSLQMGLMPLAGFAGGLVGGFLPAFFSRALGESLDQPAPYRYPLFLVGALYCVNLVVTLATREVSVEQEQGSVSGAGPLPLAPIGLMGLVMLLKTTGYWTPSVFFNVFMDAGLHAPISLIGSLVAVGQLMSGVAALAMPLLAKRWGKERVIALGTVGVAFSLLPLALIPHWAAAGAGFVAAIALTSMVETAYYVYGQEIVSPSWRPVMSGAIWMGGGLGGSSLLIGGGHIITALGYGSLFLTAAGLTCAGAILFWAYFRVPRGELAHRSSEG
jgi:MFS family permease